MSTNNNKPTTDKKLITLALSDLISYNKNNKIHWSNVDEIVKSIQANTYLTPIIVDQDNVILSGHGRKLALEKLQVDNVEVLQITGLSEKQKRDFRIRDNKLTELSEWDLGNLRFELEALDSEELNSLFEWVFDDLQTSEQEKKELIEDDIQEVTQVSVNHWDIYKIWNHILMCWDSMNEWNIKKLLEWEDNKMVHCISDPPYWISYTPDSHWMIMNDDVILDYVWLAQKYSNGFFAMRTGYQVSDLWKQLIEKYFNKITNMIIRHKWWWGMGDCERSLAQDFEILFVVNRWNYIQWHRWWSFWNWNKEEKQEWLKKAKKEDIQQIINDMIEWTVTWKVGKDWNMSYMHPAQKPVEINERVLKNFTSKGDIVLDLFGWSWSNLIACEKTWRHCRMMELDPKYCQVILDRVRSYDSAIDIKKI